MGFGFVFSIIFVLGGFAVVLFGLQTRVKLREMRHRERLAMIERGLVPPEEEDRPHLRSAVSQDRQRRLSTLGVVVVGIGLGLMLLISVAGRAPSAGVGVGGAIVVLGIAFLVNAFLCCREEARVEPRTPPAPGARSVPPALPELGDRPPADDHRPDLP